MPNAHHACNPSCFEVLTRNLEGRSIPHVWVFSAVKNNKHVESEQLIMGMDVVRSIQEVARSRNPRETEECFDLEA